MRLAKWARRRVGDARAGRVIGPRSLAALTLAAPLVLAGCLEHGLDPTLSVREAPLIAGNTYDRQNALAIIFPAAERINVSYEYLYEDELEVRADGLFAGPAWLFVERQPAEPERFLFLHLNKGEPGYEAPRGESLRLGQRRFYAIDYCLSDWRADESAEAAELTPYLAALEARGFALSRDVYMRRFIPRDVDSDGRRTSIVVIRDVMRIGYDCERLGDLIAPETEAQTETLDQLQQDASGSFEVMG